MRGKILKFIEENGLSPFEKSELKSRTLDSIFKTRDAKAISRKVLNKISSNFSFKETSGLFELFDLTNKLDVIKERQEFVKNIKPRGVNLKDLKKPKQAWKPKYNLVIVTENEKIFTKLNELNCTVKLIISQNDVQELERYDIVQVIDCPESSRVLEQLPQTVFLDFPDDGYLERYLEELSGWKDNLEVLVLSENEKIKSICEELMPLFELLEKNSKKVTKEEAEEKLKEINSKVSEKISLMTISGGSFLKIVGEGKLPEEVIQIVKQGIKESQLPEEIFNVKIPVELDEEELEKIIRKQNLNQYIEVSERIKSQASKLKKIPHKLKELSDLILLEDLEQGLKKLVYDGSIYPEYSENLEINESMNLFLENPQGISFSLDFENKCSILTGANSGGKTTLLEHIIQLITLSNIGLPVRGKIRIPLLNEVYYFAKNKGSMSKGAFETLLTQMSKINPGEKTLILADEIESVTEPGVAGKIICATADYFIKKGCFLVIATHLGQEIKNSLPDKSRIDGIEATGLDENFNLLVNHNPVLGRLARSTPELIVKRMASSNNSEYFNHLQDSILKED